MAWMKNSALTLGAVFLFFVLFSAMRYLPLILKSLFAVIFLLNVHLV